MGADQQFALILEEAKLDPNILGFFLDGSRGKGLITQYSDYDAVMVVRGEVKQVYKAKYKNLNISEIEISVMTLEKLEKDAEWGSSSAWNMYNYAHLKVDIDKTGKIEKNYLTWGGELKI